MDHRMYLAEQRVNIEIQFLDYSEDGIECMVRIRPWKGSPEDGKMVLAAGEDELVALDAASILHRAGAWEPLDWRKRVYKEQTAATLEALKKRKADGSPLPSRAKLVKTVLEDEEPAF